MILGRSQAGILLKKVAQGQFTLEGTDDFLGVIR